MLVFTKTPPPLGKEYKIIDYELHVYDVNGYDEFSPVTLIKVTSQLHIDIQAAQCQLS